jgi:hypothetical protein
LRLDRRLTALFAMCAAALLPVTAAAQPQNANIECYCRAEGREFREGTSKCLNMSGRQAFYRCEKVQNVTSWKKLSEGCPEA